MKKRVFLWILAALLLVTLAALPAFATEQQCALCGEAAWTGVAAADWQAGAALTTGHYQLTEDITITAPLTIAAGETVCIDLNGFDLTQIATSTEKTYVLRVIVNNGTLSVMDSTATTQEGEYLSGVISGGYIYAAGGLSDSNGANIYNGAGSVFNLYSGTVKGGTVQRKYHGKTVFGGGNVYSEGTVNIYGGALLEGKVWANLVAGSSTNSLRQTHVAGGNLFVVDGELNISGGLIADGISLNESYGPSAPGTYYAYGANICADSTPVTVTGGQILRGVTTANNKGADSDSGTEITAKALGGNLSVMGTGSAVISGGVFADGTVTADAAAVEGKTITTLTRQAYGGNIFGSSKTNIRIDDCENLRGTAYMGGCVYAAGTLNITGGEFSGGEAVSSQEDMTGNFGGCVYSHDTISVSGGTFTGGTARRGGNIYANENFVFTDGTIQDGVATDRGGNLGTMNGTLNISGGKILGGSATKYGGNIWCAEKLYVYDGEISNPVEGGNVMLMSNATGYIYGGTIYDGEFGSGIYTYDGDSAGPGNLYVYGGSIVSIRTGLYGSNNIHIYNGFVGRFYDSGERQITLEELDANADGMPIIPTCAHITENNGYTVWHHFEGYCQDCGHTYGSSPCEACSATHRIPAGGTHTYEVNPETGVAECIYCGLSMDGKVCCAIEGEYYSDLEEALAEAKAAGKTVKLIKDLEIRDLNLYGALDLAGYTLTVTGVLGAENKEATLTDSVGTGGVAGKLYVRQDNPQIPVLVDGVWKLEPVAMTQTLEKLSDDAALLKFVITDTPENTWLDTAAVAGDEYKIRIRVTWTENGEEKVHFFCYTPEMVAEYAAAWGEKMFTCTITGLSGLEDHTITGQLVCGATVNAKDITPPSNSSVSRYESGAGYQTVGNMLTWEKINAFPIKNDSMTVRQMRQLVVDFYNFSKTFTWVSNADNTYDAGAGYGYNTYYENNVYGAFSYVSLGTGNVYRFMDFMDERTGVVNIAEANKYPTLFGNQCSQSAYWAWGRFVNSPTTSIYTAYMVEKNGYIPVGPYTYDTTIDEFTADYGTGKIIEDNGLEVMYESYAAMQLADGLVRKFPGGHTVLCTGDPVVVRDENGAIDPAKSYILASDQISGWSTATNAMGDTYTFTRNVNVKWSFDYLIEKGYIPFTFGEFLGTDPIEETEVSYSHTGQTISRETLLGSAVTANYDILDIYAVITDQEGNEVYRLANRCQYPFIRTMTFDLEAERDGVPGAYQWGSLEDLSGDETYTVEIIAQLATGERPTLWQGRYVQ